MMLRAAAVVVMLAALPSRGWAAPEPHARVIVEQATVRAGPGLGFRSVYAAHRDEVFPIHARSTQGYWFQIELPDGTRGWIMGDAVYTIEIGEERSHGGRFLPWLFAPPPLPGAHGEIAITAGMLAGGGMLAVRPAWLLDPAFGFELNAAAAVASGGRLLLATAGPIVNVFPQSPLVPFATVQGGVTASSPNADSFLLKSGGIATIDAGIGLRIGFRYRLTLRLEARSYVFFQPDRTVAEEEYSAGLTVFF
ncbi:MAG: SH3 domain-containing protein [Polyangiales bacterium]